MGERTALVYPDGRRAEYEYNDAMQLIAMHTGGNTVKYTYDSVGRLTGKQMPGESSTSYTYNSIGRIEEILHTGADFKEHYRYDYDIRGNKVSAEKERN